MGGAYNTHGTTNKRAYKFLVTEPASETNESLGVDGG